MTHPACCGYAKNFIRLRYTEYYVSDKDYFLSHTPFWYIHKAEPANEDREWVAEELEIYFCPRCGLELPKIRVKEKLPERIVTITDGGYYCDTCGDRLNECRCSRPEDIWEVINES